MSVLPSNPIHPARLLAVPAALIVAAAFHAPAQTVPIGRIHGTPDLMQTDARGRFHNNGAAYCAPVSASNALVWLSLIGYPALLPDTAREQSQFDLVRILAGDEYMHTNDGGTSAWKVIAGLKRYVTHRHYLIRRLQYQGWRSVPESNFSGKSIPVLQWVRDACNDKTAILANIGWYRRSGSGFLRKGGHWITIVGVRNGDTLLAYDPSPRTGARKRLHEIQLERLTTGTLSGDQPNLPRPAKGYYRFTGNYPLNPKGNTALIDGVIVLELK